MDTTYGPDEYYKVPIKDRRTEEEKQKYQTWNKSRNYYHALLNILTDMDIPYEVEETNEDTIIRWEGHEKVLRYWIDPFHKWENWPKH